MVFAADHGRDSQAGFYDWLLDPDELTNRFKEEEYRDVIDSLMQIVRSFYPGDLGVF